MRKFGRIDANYRSLPDGHFPDRRPLGNLHFGNGTHRPLLWIPPCRVADFEGEKTDIIPGMSEPNPTFIWETITAHRRSAALKAGVELGVFDAFRNGPITAANLASKIGVGASHAHPLRFPNRPGAHTAILQTFSIETVFSLSPRTAKDVFKLSQKLNI